MADQRARPDSQAVLAALNAGNIELAERQARELIEQAPDAADARYALGLVHLLKGDADGSIQWLQHASSASPDNVTWRANLGVACLRAGRPEEAVTHLTRALEQQPDYVMARYNLGCALLDSGQAQQAQENFSALVRQQPGNAEYMCALGDAARALREWRKAVSCYRKAIELDAGLGRAYINLAPILMLNGQLDEALGLARKAVELEPRQVHGYKTLGDCLYRQEAFEEAMDVYADGYEVDPESPVLCGAIGDLWLETGEPGEASAWYQKTIALDDGNIKAHCGLARIVRDGGNAARALELLQPLLERAPDNADLQLALGDTYWDDGDAEASLVHFRAALELQPERVSLHARIAQVLSSSGDVDAAVAEHQRALEQNPRAVASLSGLAVTQRGKCDSAYVSTMESMLENPKLGSGQRAALHNGLAFYYDGQKDFETAARHTRQCNSYQWENRTKRGWAYDPARHTGYVTALIETFDRDYFERVRTLGNPDCTPVFIVGMPRSGTTLTEQILARHGSVLGIGERNFAGQSLHAFIHASGEYDVTGLAKLREPDREKLAGLAQLYLARLDELKHKAGKPDAARVVDKMPDNYSQLGWILTLFPNAGIIHCRRDPRAVALSCWMTQFGAIRWACKVEHLVERITQYRRLMQHWREVIPERFIELDYETLVTNQEAESKRLIEWIGLDWDDSCLSFYESDRLIRTASITQVREPIYTRSVEKWKAYEPWLPELMQPLSAMLESGKPGQDE